MLLGVYSIYLGISIAITFWVGRSLNKNGRVFLVEIFHGKEELADSVNHLLLVGFYLINIGFVCLAMRYGQKPINPVAAMEFLTTKIGLVILVLGIMHFFNIRSLVKFRDNKLFKAFDPKRDEGEQPPAPILAP